MWGVVAGLISKVNIGQRFVHFIVYLLIGLITIGVPYKLFVKKDVKIDVGNGGTYIANSCAKETPLLGCSIHRVKLKVIWQ